jgi:mannose-1-phosphate guanylyltransferase / mannose-6-phosphate isomerase
MAKVVNRDNEVMLTENESVYIKAGHKHRLSNLGVFDLIIIEVQTGRYLGEDEIFRCEDTSGRNICGI